MLTGIPSTLGDSYQLNTTTLIRHAATVFGTSEVVYRRSLPLATEHLRIIASQAGAHAGVLGAATLAIDRALSPEAIEAASAGVA